MKITQILPKFLAKTWQKYDLTKIHSRLEYYRAMVRVCEDLEREAEEEMKRLQK